MDENNKRKALNKILLTDGVDFYVDLVRFTSLPKLIHPR